MSTRGFNDAHRRGNVSGLDASSHGCDENLSIAGSEEDEHSSSMGHDDTRMAPTASSENYAPIDMVRRETQAVSCLRYLILVLLLSSTVWMSIGTYKLVTAADDSSGECSADGDGGDAAGGSSAATLDLFAQGLETNLKEVRSSRLRTAFGMSASVSSFVLESGSATDLVLQWPFVTVPHFEPQTIGLLATPDVVRVSVAPLLDVSSLYAFEAYAVAEQETACTFDGCQVVPTIYNIDGSPVGSNGGAGGYLSPVWQLAPFDLTQPGDRLMNQFSDPVQAKALTDMRTENAAVWSGFSYDQGGESGAAEASQFSPHVLLFYPIYEDFRPVDIVGSLGVRMDLTSQLQSAVPFAPFEETTLVLSSCGEALSFTIGVLKNVTYRGPIDAETANNMKKSAQAALLEFPTAYAYGEFEDGIFANGANNITNGDTVCPLEVVILPSSVAAEVADTQMAVSSDGTSSSRAIGLTSLVAAVFFVTILLFLIYDWLVERRQSIVVNIATKSTLIVENLFPAQVRDRMLQNIEEKKKKEKSGGNGGGGGGAGGDPTGMMTGDAGATQGEQLVGTSIQAGGGTGGAAANSSAPNQVSVKQFLTSNWDTSNDFSSQPIADLFPNTTVLFADIAGFTAWSSQREPPQVFTLLETLYRSFDVIAKKLKVFKVETIGDCYMAVTGLPSPDESHAVHMSRFAYQCLVGMRELIRELDAILGPGTSDLALRVGLHSGPVTAGVLRGEKSRFQLFGDTVNTASRMESTGQRGRIQVSQETADLLMAGGKSHWLKPREDLVVAKGKGELKTYWLDPTKKRRHTKTHKDIRVAQDIALDDGNSNPMLGSSGEAPFDDKYSRLIDWNVDVLLHHLARVISSRSRSPSRGSLVNHSSEVALLPAAINDVAEVVALPPFDADASKFRRARPDVSMLQQTRVDLHEYVKRIAITYRDVPFHNFEHASHVTLCANKLLNRLINSDEYESEEALHNATFGISSDPLTHFAIVFSALIHDADHTGVPNAQLIKDKHDLAVKFDNKSVAEQNSVHLGWELLMDPRFERLRKCIYQTNVERKRFRQLVINGVLATDIADRAVNENRQVKWDKAFNSPRSVVDSTPLQLQEDMNRRATAVIEHIIQVSDVAHTMQHWHIYRRWNERLFCEMHDSYRSGRVAVDPSTNWYIGELGFFDYYLIPLAMKLKECGVFGASGYEYISYVLKNKKEWERKGRQVVQEMVLLYTDADDEDESSSDSSYDSDDSDYDSPGDLSSEDGDSTNGDGDIDSLGSDEQNEDAE